jgi:hypothetical protein
MEYNIYCDESCHLEHDHQPVMVLGAVWVRRDRARSVFRRMRDIKAKHGLARTFEVKWTKVSPAKLDFYLDLVDEFFDQDELHFRALVIPDKSQLDHPTFCQDHDTWYYKMYYDLLKVILTPTDGFNVYIDIKDSRGAEKIRTLHDILVHSQQDFDRRIVRRIQVVRSHEVELIQLADLLIGAVMWRNRGTGQSEAKKRLLERIQQRSGYGLDRTTLLRENKVNVFIWSPQGSGANG